LDAHYVRAHASGVSEVRLKQHKIVSEIGVKKICIIGAIFVPTNYMLGLTLQYPSTLFLAVVVLTFILVLNISALKRPELNWVEKMETTKKSLIVESVAYALGIFSIILMLFKSIWS